MKLFNCSSCGHTIHFESKACLRCHTDLGFVPDTLAMVSVDPDGAATAGHEGWSRCANHAHGCNWLVSRADSTPFCVSCRLNRTIPDLSVCGHERLWRRLEAEKRRLIYSVLRLHLPVAPKSVTPDGLAFDFLADAPAPPDPELSGDRNSVLTGHADGLITLNIAEADPSVREKIRSEMNEPYRTILGHFRHESGHYYWDRLVRDTDWIDQCRAIFGDERADYAAALQAHYTNGPRTDWWDQYISAYAAVHPWEDWAESWSHYLHMVDTLETAWAYGLATDPRHVDSDALVADPEFDPYGPDNFQLLISQWIPLSVALNSLNRSMGHEAAYPFALTTPVIDKLAFIHRVVHDRPVSIGAGGPAG